MDYQWFLFRFESRINRAKLWLAGLIILCWMIFVLMVLAAISKVFGISSRGLAFDIFGVAASVRLTNEDPASTASLFPGLITIPMSVVFAWVYAAATIKRLHDRDKSGWWIVPFVIAPALLSQAENRFGDSYAAALPGLFGFVLSIWAVIELGFLKGTPGPNRFGPDPLAPVSASAQTASKWDQQSELDPAMHGAGPSPGPHVKRGHE